MRRLPLAWMTVTSLGLVVASAFLPWVRTGEARRSSYRLLRDLATLGVLDSGPAVAGRVLWVLLPAAAATALLLVGFGRVRPAAVVAMVAALIGLGGDASPGRCSPYPERGSVGERAMLADFFRSALVLATGRRWSSSEILDEQTFDEAGG
ncbi:MAG: hypothetical protein R2755_01095 [Acidimicrobiales bacterium]